ncbi:hypothetical protein DOJK_02298 [Patescibacteria group bacterium]|nr:hypothetical protein DOJK_02298 [Patescibacteria group bacterium]
MVLGFSLVAVNISSGNNAITQQRAARDLVSSLRYARSIALRSHQETAVLFDVIEHSYKIMPNNKTYYIPDDIGIRLQIAKTHILNGQQASIRFFSDGSSTGGRVFLTRNEVVWEITVNWLTGQIEAEQH